MTLHQRRWADIADGDGRLLPIATGILLGCSRGHYAAGRSTRFDGAMIVRRQRGE